MLRHLAIFFFAIASLSQSAFADYVQIVARAKPAVVKIEVQTEKGVGTGTGFFVLPDGYIVTNEHVIRGARRNSDVAVTGNDGTNYPVQGLTYVDKDADIAILKCDCNHVAYLEVDSDANVMEGQIVLVIGNPEGLTGTVSNGLVAAIRKDLGLIQITAPISHGSSGSPVLNEKGLVIGVVVGLYEGGQNINFCVPSDKIWRGILTVERRESYRPSYLPDYSERPAPVQRPIIENQEDAENALNASYQALRNLFDPDSQELLRQEELAWLRQRDRFKNNPDAFFQTTLDRVHLLQNSLTRLKGG
jgi:S1-C subfamily serine protease